MFVTKELTYSLAGVLFFGDACFFFSSFPFVVPLEYSANQLDLFYEKC